MQRTDYDTLPIEPYIFDNYDNELDLSTPNHHSFGGGQLHEDEQSNPNALSSDRELSFALNYTIIWKLQLRKGRITKLTEDTIEDIEVEPSTYWDETLESLLAALVEENLPSPQFQPDETTITVTNSKRGEPPFLKRFNKLVIDWGIVENKLRSWSNQGNTLKVVISFIYKESQPRSKDGKAGRGATKKHTAALNKLVAQQEASGTRSVWKDVYDLMECTSATCANKGFPCWRHNDKHYKLDSDVMDRLIDRAEQGHRLETHADVPEEIRELIQKRKEEEEARRKRKRKATEPLPVNIRVFCHSNRNDALDGCSIESELVQLDFPVPDDEAPIAYSDWLCARITNRKWQEASQLAAEVTVDKGYDLHWLYTNQKAGTEMLIASGVLEGVAARFVSWVTKWTNDVYSD